MPAPEEAVIRGQRARVRAGKLDVSRICDNLRLCSCICAPEQEYNGRLLFVKLRNNAVGELLPALALVRVCLSLTDGENGIEHQHALLRPVGQLAVVGRIVYA